MKRMVSLLLALMLILSLCLPVGAADTGADKALDVVKSRLGDTSKYDEFHSEQWTQNGQTVYNFQWSVTDSEVYESMSVSITDAGIITDYNIYGDKESMDERKPSLNRAPTEEVLETAKAFLRKLNPQIADDLLVTPLSATESLWSDRYYFRVQRTEGGIPVYGDVGSLSVSPDGKTVKHFYVNYIAGLSFEAADKAISAEDAKKAFVSEIGMMLHYVNQYKKSEKTVRPIYEPVARFGPYISAITGKAMTPVSPTADFIMGTPGAGMEDSTTESTGGTNGAMKEPLTEAEQKELQNLEGLLSIEELEAALRKITLLNLTSDLLLSRSSLQHDTYNGRYLYSLYFASEAGYVSLTADAKTGQLTRYLAKLPGKADGTVDTVKLAKTAAETLAGETLKEFRLETEEDGSVYYTRYANQIPYESDYVIVDVDPETGLLSRYMLSYSNVRFPSVEGALTAEAAAEHMFRQRAYTLCYVPNCSSEGLKAYDTGSLVYMLESGDYVMDPFTGALETQESDALPAYTDVAGHYGETAIMTLRKFGVGFASERYEPNKSITQGEFVELLSCVFYGTSPVLKDGASHEQAYSIAVSNGILSGADVASDSVLTRETAAVLLIRAMGLEKVASLPGIYTPPFTDVTSSVGHISVLGAMGVFRGDGKGLFRPASQLTRADAAIVLYNYLSI